MANPPLLLFDSDALIQVLIADALPILGHLKSAYRVQPTIVPEVEIEITSSRKFGIRFRSVVQKAIARHTLVLLDSGSYTTVLGQNHALQSAAAGVSYADIQTLGTALNKRVDRGEAYTFAAGLRLNQPVVSNDITAIRALFQAGEPLPSPVLRAYDLPVFAYQIGFWDDNLCDRFRQDLLRAGEFVPKHQKNTAFRTGVHAFAPRLIDGSRPRIGVATGANDPEHVQPLVIVPA